MLESTDIRDLSYDIVALAAALENTNGLPKESSLKTVSNLF